MTLKDILAAATPGPWLIGEEQCVAETWSIVTTTGGSIVANVNDRHDRLANARLIASAPDMAAALIEAEKALLPFSDFADFLDCGEITDIGPRDEFGAWLHDEDSEPVYLAERFAVEKFTTARAALAKLRKVME